MAFNFFNKLVEGLEKTRKNIMSGVDTVLKAFVKIDDALFEELEEALITADIGVNTATEIIANLKERVKTERVTDGNEVRRLLISEITKILESETGLNDGIKENNESYPTVILVIGVNGAGKTTTIGKLANYYKNNGKSVLLAAGDTFRAAAIDQLEVWAERSGVPVIKNEHSDPGSVIYDALNAAKARKVDVCICDTAGRLHNKKNLMEELKKIYKIVNSQYSEARLQVLLVLDATTGQNALVQAKMFSEVAQPTGLVLTKLDGTAKGGIIIAIKHELNLPVRFIGIGEKIDDLQPFSAEEFAKALFEQE